MTKTYYHATPYENLMSIVDAGIWAGHDGFVYLTTDPKDATKFLAIRGCYDILVCEVHLEEDMVEESYDHNERFFGCKAYIYPDDIPADDIRNLTRYQRN